MMQSEGVMHLPVHSLLTLQGSILIIYVIYFAPVLIERYDRRVFEYL